MRLLLFSDIHAHNFQQYSEILEIGINNRLLYSINILKEIAQACKTYQVDGVLFAGDLFHKRNLINVQVFNLIFEAIANIALQVDFTALLVGNHDQSNKDGNIHSLFSFKSIVTVLDEINWVTLESKNESIKILAVPYRDDHFLLTEKILELIKDRDENYQSVLLGHFAVKDAKIGSDFVLKTNNTVSIADNIYKNLDQIFLGHYHFPQQLKENVRYLGATHHHSWGDANQIRGYWLWDTYPNQEFSKPKLIQLKSAPLFITINLKDIEENLNHEKEKIFYKANNNKHYLRIILSEDINEVKKQKILDQLCSYCSHIEFQIKFATNIGTNTLSIKDIGHNLEIKKLMQLYIDDMGLESNLDNEYLLSIGNKYIDEVGG